MLRELSVLAIVSVQKCHNAPICGWSGGVSHVLQPGYLWNIHHRFARQRLASKTYGDSSVLAASS